MTGRRLKRELQMAPFTGVADVVERFDVEHGLRALAAAGAFRSWIEGGPRQALWTVLGELRTRRSGGPLAPAVPSTAQLPRLGETERTLMSHHVTGFDIDGHPMRHLRDYLREMRIAALEDLRAPERKHGERVTAAGIVIVRQRPGTAKGFVFVGLEDETGRVDVIVTPQLYEKEREIINSSGILAVRGRIGKEDGVVNLKAEAFFPLRLDHAAAIVRSHDYH